MHGFVGMRGTPEVNDETLFQLEIEVHLMKSQLEQRRAVAINVGLVKVRENKCNQSKVTGWQCHQNLRTPWSMSSLLLTFAFIEDTPSGTARPSRSEQGDELRTSLDVHALCFGTMHRYCYYHAR